MEKLIEVSTTVELQWLEQRLLDSRAIVKQTNKKSHAQQRVCLEFALCKRPGVIFCNITQPTIHNSLKQFCLFRLFHT